MKKSWALFLLLAPPVFGQGIFSPPQQALKVVNGITAPLPNATITVCPANASGIPCLPASISIFKDGGLTQPLSNPFTSDAFGNYQFAAASGTYTVTVTASGFNGYSYQLTMAGGLSGGTGFNTITNGTNTTASSMLCGTGCSLAPTGTGTITATNGLGFGASPVMAFYLSNFCPVANTAQCYDTPANTQQQQNCTVSTSNANVVCPSGTFAPGDVGKSLMGSAGCNPFTSNIPLAYSAPVTINTFTSSTTVVVSSVALANLGAACIVWGNPDDTAAAALETFFATGLNTGWSCPKLWLSAAGYWFNAPHFFNQPAGCTGVPGLAGGGSFGNTFLAGGFELEGRGPGVTILWMPPDFPESGSCAHGNVSTSCWAVPLEGRFHEFQLASVSNNSGSNIPAGNSLINVDVGSLEYFTCTNIGDFTSGSPHVGVQVTHWARLIQDNISHCGNTNVAMQNTVQSFGFNLALENAMPINSSSANLLMSGTGDFTCTECRFLGNQSAGSGISSIVQNTGTLHLYHPSIQAGSGSSNEFGYQCLTAGCFVMMEDANFVPEGTQAFGIFCNATCTVDLLRSKVVGVGTGPALDINTSASSSLIDRGGNTFTGGAATIMSGTYSAPGHAVNGACTGVGTAASTLGLYGTGPNVTATTCTSAAIGSGVTMAYPGTLQTLMASATAAGTNASSGVVTVLKNGVASALTCTIGTGTSCIDGTHTVSYVAGDLISLQFTTQAADTLAGVKAQVIF